MSRRVSNIKFKATYIIDGRSYPVSAMRWLAGKVSSLELDCGDHHKFVAADLCELFTDDSFPQRAGSNQSPGNSEGVNGGYYERTRQAKLLNDDFGIGDAGAMNAEQARNDNRGRGRDQGRQQGRDQGRQQGSRDQGRNRDNRGGDRKPNDRDRNREQRQSETGESRTDTAPVEIASVPASPPVPTPVPAPAQAQPVAQITSATSKPAAVDAAVKNEQSAAEQAPAKKATVKKPASPRSKKPAPAAGADE